MIGSEEPSRNLAALAVPRRGSLAETGEPFEPFRLLDPSGQVVGPVAEYLRELQGCGRPQATRVEARDFSRWVQITAKPAQPHWRHRADGPASPTGSQRPADARGLYRPKPTAGKAPPGVRYAPATAAHGETVLRSFYEFHLEAGSGPMVNPFPLSRDRKGGRANAHHNPMEAFRNERSGLYRPRLAQRAPQQIPDEMFDEL